MRADGSSSGAGAERSGVDVDPQRVHFRTRLPDDAPGLNALYNRLSAKTKYLRFIKSCSPQMDPLSFDKWLRMYHRPPLTCSVVADHAGELVAEATYVSDRQHHRAEVGIVVQDDFQRNGIGYNMLLLLAWLARQEGIDFFEADILSNNQPMLNLLRKTGCPVAFRREGDLIHFTMDLRHLTQLSE